MRFAAALFVLVVAGLGLKSLGQEADKKDPTAIVVDDRLNGKSIDIALGQILELRLKSDQVMTGWEPSVGVLRGNNLPPLVYVSQKFEPEPKAIDPALGTSFIRYRAAKEGEFDLRIPYVYPGGPNVTARKATKLVREFRLTVKVTK